MKLIALVGLGTSLTLFSSSAQAFHFENLYFGTVAGFAYLASDAPAELNKAGYHDQPSFLASFHHGAFAFDGGASYWLTEVSGESSGAVREERAELFLPSLELGTRWMFHPQWHIGLRTNMIFGDEAEYGPRNDGRFVALFKGPEFS